MASRKNTDRKKPPAGESAAQRQTGQELLVDGRRDGSFPIVGLGASAAGLEAAGMSCVAANITFQP